ncbi:acyl-CoA dehydrogenase [Mycolicibacillus parakoreensis]|uniref:Acyl-CoA dehydrogenase family protein n=1 Tax=Mycolicibacillus parakoreensis TaxID=1069221 RepID=A0ABY3TXW2_9MYCO|nr:acyl-CoA dehydrogenase family protein [Mycolicibacillus parakoreensis]MCV7317129.1 acyl-CoA dehydrogenase [Mycolicibacillus parakoreensis]ULN51448.1 acyl-CoA dehydrogenase family protein [Mycolicibacillus parakoreensis]
MSVEPTMDADSLRLLERTLRTAMTAAVGADLDAALGELGWRDMLIEMPETATRVVFQSLGETGSHASVLNDVVAHEAGRADLDAAPAVPLPFAGGSWVIWQRTAAPSTAIGGDIPVQRVGSGQPVPLAAGRRALGWWLTGTSRAMLALARRHALDRTQFGKPIAAFQAVRHRLAETLVAIEGAEAALATAGERPDELCSLLGKAAAGDAALVTARHCQQVLGGVGFTAEHDLHVHVERVLLLDGMLGSTRELTREAGAAARAAGAAPRLVDL